MEGTSESFTPDNFLVGGRRHARLPSGIAELQHVAARVEKIKFTAGEVALLAIDHRFGDLDALLVEQLGAALPHVRAHHKGMMQTIVLLRGARQRLLALAQQNIVAAGLEAGHFRTAQTPFRLEAENLA